MARQLQESAVFAKLGVTEQNSVLKTTPSFSPRCGAAVVEKKKEGEVDQYSVFEELCSVTQPLCRRHIFFHQNFTASRTKFRVSVFRY